VRIQLSKSNFFYNLDHIQKYTKDVNKIAIVLKDNAYGHGLLEMATMAVEYGITKAIVRSNAEAHAIESMFAYILVLADTPDKPSQTIRYTINDIKTIKKFAKGTLVELKVNTSMNRNGIHADELERALDAIQAQDLALEAIFTHHACADELGNQYAYQKKNFAAIKESAPQGLRFHSCNSAALFREDDFSEDMARVGIAAYGCLELPEGLTAPDLQPVLSLYADKISSRELEVGDSVGYGATFKAQEKCSVSNYDFGYGDGFFCACSNEYQTPEGVKIAGRISMDNSSFISTADELLIFNDARVFGTFAKTFSYEVLCSLKAYIKREIV